MQPPGVVPPSSANKNPAWTTPWKTTLPGALRKRQLWSKRKSFRKLQQEQDKWSVAGRASTKLLQLAQHLRTLVAALLGTAKLQAKFIFRSIGSDENAPKQPMPSAHHRRPPSPAAHHSLKLGNAGNRTVRSSNRASCRAFLPTAATKMQPCIWTKAQHSRPHSLLQHSWEPRPLASQACTGIMMINAVVCGSQVGRCMHWCSGC